MASENLSADDATNGFTRPEMYTENLSGTVDAYDRHVFLCYKSHESWPPRVEASDADPLPKLVAATWKARKNDIAVKTKITVCEAREEAGFSDGDVLIFPEMIKYRGLEESNVDSFFEDVLVNGKPWAAGVPEVLTGSHVFVCAHGSRDVRCGVCGPVLIEKLNEEIELRGLKDQIFVTACSHVGGHKYAGNLIIYSPGPDGKIMGHWYGYVTPNDVPELLDQHISKGEVIQRIWRGQMGPYIVEVNEAYNQKLANGEDTSEGKKHHIESDNLSIKENVAGCCQGVNGVSCCRTASLEQNNGIEETTQAHKKQGSKISWNWPVLQEHDILTAVGVLGAVAAVTVAYKLYRRSG
ncbi:altered inheritance of mitochondria protein 32-like [Gastrolobium bilobum]|uniref:altered inheritance of mitochondria protein 32-like n=1 Tax=Gastrolobium bilobum TaxID=150636 RepID=UPI002AB264E1|nr:altered inheritance of mitochondria protein 32-like [Gastrolobium bilobum]